MYGFYSYGKLLCTFDRLDLGRMFLIVHDMNKSTSGYRNYRIKEIVS